jgi:uncharacterized C2H2 Zn-finger protein
MARELVIQSWCDVCLAADTKTAVTVSEVVRLGTAAAVQLDLCADHAAPVVAVRELLTYGTPPDDTPPPAARDDTCPICGRNYLNRGSLTAHVRQVHHTTMSAVRGKPAAAVTCPVCGRTFAANQGLASHVGSSHGTTLAARGS